MQNEISGLYICAFESKNNLYDESNKYLHPSAFLGLSKKFRKKVKTQSTRYCWFSKVSGLKKNDKLDFLIRTLTYIFYDIFWDVFNEVIVPLNPECKVVKKPAKMPNTQITIKAYLEFAENKKNQAKPDWATEKLSNFGFEGLKIHIINKKSILK